MAPWHLQFSFSHALSPTGLLAPGSQLLFKTGLLQKEAFSVPNWTVESNRSNQTALMCDHITANAKTQQLSLMNLPFRILKVKVAQLCLTVCNPTDYTVHGILQARKLEWLSHSLLQGIIPSQGSNPGLSHRSLGKAYEHYGIWHLISRP